jgi:hypothetical protein
MKVRSFHAPPVDGEAVNQGIDGLLGAVAALVREVGVAGGGEDGGMPEDALDFAQVNTGFDQMGGVTVA